MAPHDEPGSAVVPDYGRDHDRDHAETGNDHALPGSADTTPITASPSAAAASAPAVPPQRTAETPPDQSHNHPDADATAVSHESSTGDADANANVVTATVIVEAAPSSTAEPTSPPASAAAAAGQPTDTSATNPSSSDDTPAQMPSSEQAPTPAPAATVAPTTITTAEEAASEGIKEVDELGPSLTITLLLITGARHQFKIDGKYLKRRSVNVENQDPFSMSVYTLKELIWREWRSEWEPRPSSPSSIRLISFGKLLDDKSPLSDSRFSRDAPNVVHMTVKPQEVVEEEDAKGGKSHYGREREASERSPGCRCIVL